MIIEVDRALREFRKRAETGEEADRLRHEARVLDVARHPGVVLPLGLDNGVLRLRLIEGDRLSDLESPSAGGRAAIAVAAATTLADLHDIGVAHGAITAEHILIDGSGQPILCGFGRGATDVEVGVGGADAAGDVAALARALLVGTTADASERGILTAAARAGRNAPSARRLAALLAASSPPGRPRSPRPALVAVSVVVATATVAALVIPPLTRLVTPRSDCRTTARPATWRPGCPVPSTHRTGQPPGGSPALPPCPAVDRGCQPLPELGGTIETSRGRYRIGGPGDVLVVGRWRCGAALPALLRPATGEVWAFDSWVGATGQLPARLVTRIPGALSMRVHPGSSGCDRLVVLRRVGAAAEVRPGGSA